MKEFGTTIVQGTGFTQLKPGDQIVINGGTWRVITVEPNIKLTANWNSKHSTLGSLHVIGGTWLILFIFILICSVLGRRAEKEE